MINPDELLCNLCGGPMCPHEVKMSGTWQSDVRHGLVDAKVVGGYESYHLLDMNQYTFSFCEQCLRKLFVQCKIKPEVHRMNFSSGLVGDLEEREEYPWEDDQKSYEYRVWCDDGKHHQAYLNKKCNAAADCPEKAFYTVWLSDHFTEDSCCEEHTSRWRNCVNAKLVPFIPNVLKPFL